MKDIAECIPQDDLDCYYNIEWLSRQRSSKHIVNNFTIIQDKIDENFYNFINEAKNSDDPVLDNLIQLRESYYHRNDGSPSLKKLVNMVENINSVEDLAYCVRKFMEIRIFSFFGIDIMPNYKDPSVYTLSISEPLLTFDTKSNSLNIICKTSKINKSIIIYLDFF